MTFAASNARYRSRQWANDPDQVNNLSRDLIRVGVLVTADDVQEFHEAPWGWSREHEWWMANGCTDNPDQWADAGMIPNRKDT